MQSSTREAQVLVCKNSLFFATLCQDAAQLWQIDKESSGGSIVYGRTFEPLGLGKKTAVAKHGEKLQCGAFLTTLTATNSFNSPFIVGAQPKPAEISTVSKSKSVLPTSTASHCASFPRQTFACSSVLHVARTCNHPLLINDGIPAASNPAAAGVLCCCCFTAFGLFRWPVSQPTKT